MNRAIMKRHILVVDDEVKMLDILGLYFRGNGYEVTTAETGGQARDLLSLNRFDLTILDLNLAGEDGLDVLNLIKGIWPEHPVIIFTGVGDNELVLKQHLADRADAFMRKTVGLPPLLAEVRRLMPGGTPAGGTNGYSQAAHDPGL
jgi:two-component system, OmpR family, response regulator